jgi:uncharacterized protein (TIGR02145 family)
MYYKKSNFLNAMFVAIAMISATMFYACSTDEPKKPDPDDDDSKANEWVFDGKKLAIDEVEIKYYGDFAKNGTENFVVNLYAKPVTIDGGEYISYINFDIFTDAAPLNGTFTYENNFGVAGIFDTGERYYVTATTRDEGTEYAYIEDGSITVKKLSGSNQYEISLKVTDEEGIKSTAYYKGKVTYIDKTEPDDPNPDPDPSTVDEGVLINGVVWATRNIDAPGHFADNDYDAGMFYQWNRNIGWSSTDPMVNSNGGTEWDSTFPEGDTWAAANDPSPAGWRIPTKEEQLTLLDTEKVSSESTAKNGVGGYLFTDIATGNELFMPAAGYRSSNEGGALNGVRDEGDYWSSTAKDAMRAYYLLFYSSSRQDDAPCVHGFSIRSVAE